MTVYLPPRKQREHKSGYDGDFAMGLAKTPNVIFTMLLFITIRSIQASPEPPPTSASAPTTSSYESAATRLFLKRAMGSAVHVSGLVADTPLDIQTRRDLVQLLAKRAERVNAKINELGAGISALSYNQIADLADKMAEPDERELETWSKANRKAWQLLQRQNHIREVVFTKLIWGDPESLLDLANQAGLEHNRVNEAREALTDAKDKIHNLNDAMEQADKETQLLSPEQHHIESEVIRFEGGLKFLSEADAIRAKLRAMLTADQRMRLDDLLAESEALPPK